MVFARQSNKTEFRRTVPFNKPLSQSRPLWRHRRSTYPDSCVEARPPQVRKTQVMALNLCLPRLQTRPEKKRCVVWRSIFYSSGNDLPLHRVKAGRIGRIKLWINNFSLYEMIKSFFLMTCSVAFGLRLWEKLGINSQNEQTSNTDLRSAWNFSTLIAQSNNCKANKNEIC